MVVLSNTRIGGGGAKTRVGGGGAKTRVVVVVLKPGFVVFLTKSYCLAHGFGQEK